MDVIHSIAPGSQIPQNYHTPTMKLLGLYFGLCLTLSAIQGQAYFTTNSTNVLGSENLYAGMGNPLKGLLTSPTWTGQNTSDAVPSSLEFHYIRMDEIMKEPTLFDWTVLDETINRAKSRQNHVIWRIYIHYPGRELAMPKFLVNQGLVTGGQPKYDDERVRNAVRDFIMQYARRYDGNKYVAFIQMGLLGKWGEWHTYPDQCILSQTTMDLAFGWYTQYFKKTKLQVRYPIAQAKGSGVGYHDDSFGFSTLDGASNGGEVVNWFFWPRVKNAGQTDFWKTGVMGGETRPELQETIFESGYRAGTPNKQDFFTCVDVTHATYMLHHDAFKGNGYTGTELANARKAHVRMGYNFRVAKVSATKSSSSSVSVSVTVKQIGVAPFYYPLHLGLSCAGMDLKKVGGVETLLPNAEKAFIFTGVSSSSACLASVNITLETEYAYAGKPIKFAQGSNGIVQLSIPQPPPPNTEDNELGLTGRSYSTSYDTLTFSSNSEAEYPQYDGGKVSGTFNPRTRVFEGKWGELSSARNCGSTGPAGTNYWGRVRFTFSEDLRSFTGVWGYCNSTPTHSWSGTQE